MTSCAPTATAAVEHKAALTALHCVSGRPKSQYLRLSTIVAVTESIVAVPVSTSSIASICVQITGISCWSTASGPPPAISPAKPGGSTRSGRV